MRKLIVNLLQSVAIVAALCYLLTSCVTEKKRREICKSCVTVIKKDSIIREYKDTIIYILQQETEPVYLPNPCGFLCDSANKLNKVDTIIKNKKGSIKIKSFGNWLTFQSTIDSLKAITKKFENYNYKSEVKVIEKPCDNECKKIHVFYTYYFYFTSLIIILYLIFKTIKNKYL